MPRVFCTHCKKGHVKVPFAVLSVTFRCPNCGELIATVTEWEQQRVVRGEAPPPTSERPRLPAIVTEAGDSFVGAERVERVTAPPPSWPRPSPPPPPPAPPPPPPLETRLTSPHPCTQCGHLIRTPLRRDRATVVCPSCSNRTSLYAVIFRCVCGVMLESPVAREGEEDSCPACGQRVRIPADVVSAEPDPASPEAWFRFEW